MYQTYRERSGLMLTIVVDMVLLWAIVSIGSRQKITDEMFKFFIAAAVLFVIGFVGSRAESPVMALLVYSVSLLLMFRFLLDCDWVGSLIGTLAFIGVKVLLLTVFGV